MEAFGSLIDGFGIALHPMNLVWAFVGSVLGTAIGVLPGIGPALTIALLLPVTTQIAPTSAFIMFAGVLYGAMYGGSTTSILLNTPGEAGSMMTALEGNRMARNGRGAAALATAAIGSFVAGTIATLALTFAAPAIAEIAFIFGPEDYFALMVLSFTCVAVVMGASRVRGFISLFLGLALGVVGIDQTTGQARLTFGSPQLLDGIELTVVLVSLFAIGETIYVASRYRRTPTQINPLAGGAWMTRGGLAALLLAVDSRHAARLPDRRAAGRRLGDPDLPLLRGRAAAREAGRRNSAMAPSRASPDRRPPTTRPPPACWCRC